MGRPLVVDFNKDPSPSSSFLRYIRTNMKFQIRVFFFFPPHQFILNKLLSSYKSGSTEIWLTLNKKDSKTNKKICGRKNPNYIFPSIMNMLHVERHASCSCKRGSSSLSLTGLFESSRWCWQTQATGENQEQRDADCSHFWRVSW